MNFPRSLLASLSLAVLSASAFAAPTVGSGGGYYGGVDYAYNFGATVGPYPTYAQCQAMLQSTIAYDVANRGYQVVTVYPCKYNPPYTIADYEVGFAVWSEATDGSSGTTGEVLSEYTRLRDRYKLDAYEAELGALHRRINKD